MSRRKPSRSPPATTPTQVSRSATKRGRNPCSLRGQALDLRERLSSEAPARGRRPQGRSRTATAESAHRSGRRRSATRQPQGRGTFAACGGVRVRRRRLREARDLLAAKSGSVSAVANAHHADHSAGGSASSATPHRPMPVSSFRWTRTCSAPALPRSSARGRRPARADFAARRRPHHHDPRPRDSCRSSGLRTVATHSAVAPRRARPGTSRAPWPSRRPLRPPRGPSLPAVHQSASVPRTARGRL